MWRMQRMISRAQCRRHPSTEVAEATPQMPGGGTLTRQPLFVTAIGSGPKYPASPVARARAGRVGMEESRLPLAAMPASSGSAHATAAPTIATARSLSAAGVLTRQHALLPLPGAGRPVLLRNA